MLWERARDLSTCSPEQDAIADAGLIWANWPSTAEVVLHAAAGDVNCLVERNDNEAHGALA